MKVHELKKERQNERLFLEEGPSLHPLRERKKSNSTASALHREDDRYASTSTKKYQKLEGKLNHSLTGEQSGRNQGAIGERSGRKYGIGKRLSIDSNL